jgi:hypothetical protein
MEIVGNISPPSFNSTLKQPSLGTPLPLFTENPDTKNTFSDSHMHAYLTCISMHYDEYFKFSRESPNIVLVHEDAIQNFFHDIGFYVLEVSQQCIPDTENMCHNYRPSATLTTHSST